ncbi:MAG TPA: galactose oxidase-like domain-containing protein, partial [Candidatus Dormibacteraeota bacterium]|nr:galactose oxidase-like domain-containing protein [Candidatus Dormibacteraeota bacterium]
MPEPNAIMIAGSGRGRSNSAGRSAGRAWRHPRRLFAAGRLALAALLMLAAAPAAAGGPAVPAAALPAVRLVASDPSQVGQWGALMNWPLDAVHASLMPSGSVLLWDAWETGGTPSVRLWNPATGAFTAVPNQTSQLFCSGHVQLADGRLLVVGGHNGGDTGINDVNAFDSGSASWSLLPSMNYARWYPAVARLGDGRVVAISGNITPSTIATTPEVYDPATSTWTALSSINTQIDYDAYPQDYTLPDGRVFVLDSEGGQVRLLDARAGTWTAGPASPVLFGSSTMYRPGKILVSGGGAGYGAVFPSLTSAETIDMTAASPTWTQIAPMAYPRYQHNLVTLPDGNVLALGGSVTVNIEEHNGSLPAELWSPQTGQWATVAAEQNPRMYHSTAVLLPDGRVLSAGGGRLGTATDYLTAEIYSPPYLFKGARPSITSAPSTAGYAGMMSIQSPDAASIASVALVNLPSNTHTMDFGQAYVPLSFSVSGSTLNVQAPLGANVAPPGYYMLFLVNSSGVPSMATLVQLSQPADTQPPAVAVTAPAAGATLSGTVGLSAGATDNVGVAG